MAEPQDMIMPMLREMREDINNRFDNVDKRFDTVDQRLAKIDSSQKSYKAALSVDTLLSRLLIGEFEMRLEALEAEIKTLKAGH